MPEVAARARVRACSEREARRPGGESALLPPVGVEAGRPAGSPGTSSCRPAQEQRADQTTRPGGMRVPPRSTSRVGDAGGDPGGRGQAQRLPHGVDGVDASSGWSGEPGEQPSAGGDGDLDAGGQHGRQLLRGAVDASGCASQASFERPARVAAPRDVAAPPAGRASGGDHGAERVDPAEDAVGDARRVWSRSSDGRTAAVVDRATGRRSSSMASYGSSRACPFVLAASAASHSRRRSATPRATCSGASGREDACGPSAVSPRLPDEVAGAAHVAREVERSRVGQHLPSLGRRGGKPRPVRAERDHARAWARQGQRRAGRRPTRRCPCA